MNEGVSRKVSRGNSNTMPCEGIGTPFLALQTDDQHWPHPQEVLSVSPGVAGYIWLAVPSYVGDKYLP
jgi:hypothetical protein